MFCPKCGTKASDHAVFCQNCGEKLLIIPPTSMSSDSSAGQIKQPPPPPADIPKKKKSFKLPILLGFLVLVIAVAVFIALNRENKMDYKATVRAYTPYANSQKLPYTCGEVFDRFLPDAKWAVRETDDSAYVDISGTAKGTDKKLTLTIRVEVEGDQALFTPTSAEVDGRELNSQKDIETVFFALFTAYDKDYNDLSDFGALLNEVEGTSQKEVRLTQRFQDRDAGISFRYPEDWEILDSPSEYKIVEMLDSKNTADCIATFDVSVIWGSDPYEVFTRDRASVRKAVNEHHKFLELEDILLDDVPSKALKYQSDGLSGDTIVAAFWYIMGETTYQITCTYTASAADIYEPIFQSMMESYAIEPPANLPDDPLSPSGTEDSSTADLAGEDTLLTEEASLVMDGDENTRITFRPDGTFTMDVNLYVGYGNLSGTYEFVTDNYIYSVQCYVETRDFLGYIGDDVTEFELIPYEDHLIYLGETIGSTMEGSFFYYIEV